MMLMLALSGIGLIMAGGPAVARPDGDGDGHRGTVGRHAFVDSEERPGARCRYQPVALIEPAGPSMPAASAEFVGIGVRPPKVAAIDRSPGVDRQRVGWRFILQERLPGGEWTKVKRSPLQVVRTTDQRAARFIRMTVRYDGDPLAEYRVRSKAYWFRGRLRPVGVAIHLVDHYRVRGDITPASCPGGMPEAEVP